MTKRVRISCFAVFLLGMSLLVDTEVVVGASYTLEGKVLDTSDNWLNGVQVTLLPVGVKAQTDANGEFLLEFEMDEALESTDGKPVKIESGHLGETIETSMAIKLS